jgi:hypothetical protein
MPVKIGKDEFCVYCMEWREYDEEGRCKVCKHLIYRGNKKSEKEGYNELKSKSTSIDDIEESNENYDF